MSILRDDDSTTLSFLNITIKNFESGVDTFNFDTEADSNITGQFLSGTLLLTGPASIDEFTAVLRSVRYVNSLVETDQFDQLLGTRVIEITANDDGSATSQIASAFVTFEAVNDPPLVDLNGPEVGSSFSVDFTEGDQSVAISSTQAVITDVDSNTLTFVTAQLFGAADNESETLFINETTTLIVVSYNSTNNLLTLSGPAELQDFQTLIRSLYYKNTATEPGLGSRTIEIIASDGMATSTPVTSTVSITTINDPPTLSLEPFGIPYFEEGDAIPLVKENTVVIEDPDNTLLTTVQVTILNAINGANEVISTNISEVIRSQSTIGTSVTYTFMFPGPSQIFNFVSLVESLTYENFEGEPALESRKITVQVSDGASFSDVINITVDIILINDNPPIFLNDNITLSLSESSSIGDIVTQVEAEDADEDSIVVYSLMNPHFTISPLTGILTVNESLDREETDMYILSITASDGLHSATLSVTILITDVNDNVPTASESRYEVEVSEGASVGTRVFQLSAVDRDVGVNAEFIFELTEASAAFTVHQHTGLITTITTLDRETEEMYELIIIIVDGGSPSLSSTVEVVVMVTDVNDNPPVFNSDSVTVAWSEDIGIGSEIFTARATDLDSSSDIQYELLSGNGDGLFSVGASSGEVDSKLH